MAQINFSEALRAATLAAKNAASVLQIYAQQRGELIVDHKARNDLVSQADREAEDIILEILQEKTPDYAIIAEESGAHHESNLVWYIDPLDGTTNFIHGLPHYAVSIGLIAKAGTQLNNYDSPLTEDTPVISVVYDPCRQEMFTAVYNDGCWLNDQRIQCSKQDQLSSSLLATGIPFRDFSFEDQYLPTFDYAMRHTRGIRRLGSAALDLAWVACGRYEGYWEMGLAPWDVCAGTLLVREAGGRVEDMYEQLSWPSNGYIIAANSGVFDELKAMIKPHLTAPISK